MTSFRLQGVPPLRRATRCSPRSGFPRNALQALAPESLKFSIATPIKRQCASRDRENMRRLRIVSIVAAAFAMLTFSLLSGCAYGPRKGAKIPDMDQARESFSHKGVTLRYTDSGKGEPVLFLHGFAVSSYTWRHVADRLSGSNRVICLDLKGFGASDKPRDSDYSAYGQAEIIAAFLEQRDLKNVTVVGNSFGGRVTMALYSRLSGTGRIKRLVLVDSAGPDGVLPLQVRLAKTPPMPSVLATVLPAGIIAKEAVDAAFYDTALIEPDAVDVYAAHLGSPGAMEAFAKTASLVFARDDREKVWDHLDRVDIPVLIIWGEYDGVIPLANGQKLQELIPHSQLVVISRCGHMPQEEKPQETTEAILQFLREH